ncbi:hypothetical protein E8E13_001736 [Curvularia kusanoi]|uniref:DUF7053 domain-containing protein n=1 Tax=Curvularia kusanoi TaxID=90978 RepID=A0A9P4TFX9_CURKU|nr:hypothetical protein E8E13_001736 [Curvularia kusanoi]
MYKDHLAMIDLNPLVVERFKCKPPAYAPTSEYYAAWYTIKDKVSYLPGGLATGSVSYHAVFHDFPDCLETHVYAPLGLDIRGKWSVGGSLPGEPKDRTDPGLKVPRTGLYIREEVKMTCSKLLMGFVKKTFKDSHSHLVEKLVERAHILESNLANQRLKALRSVDPKDRMGHGNIFIAPPPDYQFAPPPYRSLPELISSHVVSPPEIPEVRPISFNLAFEPPTPGPLNFAFGPLTPGPKTPISNEDLLADIDAAIDESYLYAALPTPNALNATFQYEMLPAKTYEFLPATTYSASPTSSVDTLPSTTYNPSPTASLDTLPSTTYEPAPQVLTILPSTTYSPNTSATYSPGTFLPSATYTPLPKHGRKDSVMPHHTDSEDIPPVVPPKDEKYMRRPSKATV